MICNLILINVALRLGGRLIAAWHRVLVIAWWQNIVSNRKEKWFVQILCQCISHRVPFLKFFFNSAIRNFVAAAGTPCCFRRPGASSVDSHHDSAAHAGSAKTVNAPHQWLPAGSYCSSIDPHCRADSSSAKAFGLCGMKNHQNCCTACCLCPCFCLPYHLCRIDPCRLFLYLHNFNFEIWTMQLRHKTMVLKPKKRFAR